jgi:Adenylate and Guanylate cyclase catalytic domain
VVENTCDQVFTFRVSGIETEFLGDGDLHDVAFDSMVWSTLFGRYLMDPIDPNQTTYRGISLDDSFCSFSFRVYPTQEMKDRYVTNRPTLYTVGACLIMLFTSLVFVSYDCLVERRQKIVSRSAERSDAIVSSLFPTIVKEKLYKEQEQKMLADAPQSLRQRRRSNRKVKQFMNGAESSVSGTIGDEHDSEEYEQIASLYPETTILFADIAGFTQWSSGRDPQEVFILLETIYFMFDKIAKRRGVFKFSTIGDCYLGEFIRIQIAVDEGNTCNFSSL